MDVERDAVQRVDGRFAELETAGVRRAGEGLVFAEGMAHVGVPVRPELNRRASMNRPVDLPWRFSRYPGPESGGIREPWNENRGGKCWMAGRWSGNIDEVKV